MKYAWIDAQRADYPLPELCVVLCVSASGWRAWRRGGTPNPSRPSDAQAVVLMKAIHAEVKGAYGSRRMHRELQGRGHRIGLARVERLMREHGIRARRKLAVLGHRAGPVQPRSHRLVDQAAHDGGHRDRCADDGVVPGASPLPA